MSFCQTLEECDWVLQSLIPDMIMEEDFYKHHLQVVSTAMNSARSMGVAIHTVRLLDYELPYVDRWETPGLNSLSVLLRQLLEHTKVLRLHRSHCVLRLLSKYALDLHQLDMCGLEVVDEFMEKFLEVNKKTIRSIGFHNETILRPSWPGSRQGSRCPMTASVLCNMLKIPLSTPCRASDCGCHPWRKEGSRLLMNHDRLPRSAGASAKRKFDDR